VGLSLYYEPGLEVIIPIDFRFVPKNFMDKFRNYAEVPFRGAVFRGYLDLTEGCICMGGRWVFGVFIYP